MRNIHSNPTPLRQKFIEYLTLNRKAERTVHCYVSFIYSLAKHYGRSPELLGADEIQRWLLSPNCRAQASPFDHQLGHQCRALLLRQTPATGYRGPAQTHQTAATSRPLPSGL